MLRLGLQERGIGLVSRRKLLELKKLVGRSAGGCGARGQRAVPELLGEVHHYMTLQKPGSILDRDGY
jgi:hypothetical protein